MRKYETVFISDPDMSDQAREELLERVKSILDKEKGILLNVDTWGLKKLSYEIKKKLRGYYVCLTYGGTGELVTELERNFRLSDLIMKFMTILITEHVTEESLRQEAEEAKEADEAKEAAAQQAEESATKEEAPQEAEEEKNQGDAEETSDKAEENADDQDDAQETESEKTSEPAEESKE